MSKIIIWDSNIQRKDEYSKKFSTINENILKITTNKTDLDGCKIFFRHKNDNIPEDLNFNIIIEFTGGICDNSLKIENEKIKASIDKVEKIYNILNIIDKEEYDINDVHYILEMDPILEEQLLPFNNFHPTTSNAELTAKKQELKKYVDTKLKDSIK